MSATDEFLDLLRNYRGLRGHVLARRGRVARKWMFGLVRKLLRQRTLALWPDSRGAYIPVDDGLYFYIPRQLDLHGYTVLARGLGENYLGPLLTRYCPPGAVAFDIGANIGEMSLCFAQAVGPAGRVVAFEPIPFMADAIARTATINGLAQMQVVHAALSDAPAQLHIEARWRSDAIVDSGGSRISDTPTPGSVPVAALRLDDWCAAHLAPDVRLGLVKIDVEGHELAVLAGARATLARYRPVLALEVGHEGKERRCAIADLLGGLGYAPTAAVFRHALLPLEWRDVIELSGPLAPGGSYDIILHPADPAPLG